mmetsp:Transcript_8463/g.19880  ORF Transcript_8463/g.19880 Transcript_8463/m.19880 type:complete len:330 (+) Transcript_8463:636-1625(+)
MDAGVLSVPPPILSRAYQELANGMVAFHECVKISDTPFPFPYAQNCEFLLCLHWFMIPFVVSQWVTQPFWAFVFVFMQVFVLWSLNYIAVEIENPFGTSDNDIDGVHLQEEMNRMLLLLLDPRTLRTPKLSETAIFSSSAQELHWGYAKKKCFKEVWKKQRRLQKKMVKSRKDIDFVGVPANAAKCVTSSADEGSQEEVRGQIGPPHLSPEVIASWGIMLQEGKTTDASSAGKGSQVSPALGRGYWEATPLPQSGQWQRSTSPSQPTTPKQSRATPDDDTGSGSDAEDECELSKKKARALMKIPSHKDRHEMCMHPNRKGKQKSKSRFF